jgi:spore germination protein YaaH
MIICLVLLMGLMTSLAASPPALTTQQQKELSLKQFKQQWEDLRTTPAFQPAPFVPGVIRCIDPTQSPRVNRTVFGYYAGQGYEGIDFSLLSHLALAFVDADANGHISQLPLSSYPNWYGAINAAHDQGVQVVLVVRNQYFDSDVLSSIVSDENKRAVLIDELLNTIQSHCLDGVSVDFENVNSADREYVTLFMEELAQALHSADHGYHLSFATPAYDWGNDFDYPALSRICDALLMMQYVYYGSWSSTAGPQAPIERSYGLSLINSIQGEYLDLGIPSQKLVLLMPYYGYQWKVSAGSDPSQPGASVTGIYDTILINENPFPNMTDDETIDLRGQYFHYFVAGDTWVQGWCDEARSIGKKCDLVHEVSLQGVGMWRLEYGNGYPELWREIEEHFAPAIPEMISTPATPSGPLSGNPGTSYPYSTGGSSSNLGHPLEYRFDWGDGNYSNWSSSTSASKSWASAGTYNLKAQARCATHPSVVSDLSPGLLVSISLPPPPPTNLWASDGTYTDKVRVTWTGSSGATGYKIFRNTSNNSSGAQQMGTSTALTYDDMTAVEGTSYWYWVKAYSDSGDSEFSNGDSGYVALSWHSESVNWAVYYGNNWNRSGTLTKPGAVRIRLHFSTISVEAWYDHLRTDVGDDWSGDYRNVTSREKAGNSIGLTLTSDYSRTGYFIIDRVEWQGSSTGPATKGGTLFQAAESLYFGSGWEDGQTLGFTDRVQYSKSVAGYFNTSNPPPECSRRYRETVHSGDYALMIAGYSQASYAYCYYRVFDLNIKVVEGMKIGYWIYHAVGTSKISVDGHFTDGTTIRDFYNNGYLTDQYGVRIHPAFRKDPMNQWYYVAVDLSKAAGKTLAFIMFAFDNGSDGFTGQYRAYVDDFKVFSSKP